MGDGLDVPLEDTVLREEVEILSSLMIVAGRADGPLDQEQIDDLLGLDESAAAPSAGGVAQPAAVVPSPAPAPAPAPAPEES